MGKSIIINGVSFFDNRIPNGEVTPVVIYDITVEATNNKYINTTNGNVGSLNGAAYTRMISCAGYSSFLLQTTFYYKFVCAFYDSNGVFLSGINESEDGNTSYSGAIPEDAYYVVFNYRTSSVPSFLRLQ